MNDQIAKSSHTVKPELKAGLELPKHRSLSETASRGFLSLICQTFVTKIVNTLGQIVLAWLLVPEDFGVIGLAYMILTFVGICRFQGLNNVLIHRQSKIRIWGSVVLWMSLAASIFAAVLICVSAPFIASFYHQPVMTGLLVVLSFTFPLEALAIVPSVRLQTQLRFSMWALISGITIILQMILTTGLAFLHFGVYSFAWARVMSCLFYLVVAWRLTMPKIHWKPRPGRWRFIAKDGIRLTFSDLSNVFTYQGDYLILGLFRSPQIVGQYYFAYNLSTQVTQLISGNLAGILLPAMSVIQSDKDRLGSAFIRACKIIAVVGFPLGILQASLASPIIHLVFPEKWYPAITVLQILSIGMAVVVVTRSAENLIKALGRFDINLWLSIAGAVSFAVCVVIGTWLGGAIGTAIGVTAALVMNGLVQMFIALRLVDRPESALFSIFGPPVLSTFLTQGLGIALVYFLPKELELEWVKLVLICGISLIYLPLIRIWIPEVYCDILSRFRTMRK